MLRNAWVMWGILLVVICVIIGLAKDPVKQKSVTGNYRTACVAWWDRQPIYQIDDPENIDGFLYFPQAAILHTPFSYGPPVVGEWLWRCVILSVFVAGVWRLSRLAREDHRPDYFAVISFLAVFSVAGNLRNGQSNLLMAGTMMLAAADIYDKSWWKATLWIVLGVLLKPLGMVMLLLVGALYFKPMARRLAVGLVIGAALPFITAPWEYALAQHVDFVTKMRAAGDPNRMFADFKGMLDNYLIPVPGWLMFVIRALMALATLGLIWIARQRFGDQVGALALVAGATVYLMLFNPRTEGLSYVALAPIMGVFFCRSIWQSRNLAVAIWLGTVCVLFGLEYELISKHIKAGPGWFKPPMAVLFGGYLIYLLFISKPLNQSDPDKALAPRGEV